MNESHANDVLIRKDLVIAVDRRTGDAIAVETGKPLLAATCPNDRLHDRRKLALI